MTAARYAVYWVPDAGHPLWAAGCRWLGRDPEVPGAGTGAPPWARAPWRYGFHATLKAPMALRAGGSEAGFVDAVAALAARHADFLLPPLQVAWLGDFLALRPLTAPEDSHPLRRLADACVAELDAWRRPATAAEVASRAAPLHSDAQRALLVRWGYPHVFTQWRFHMTLSDSAPADARALEHRARAHFAATLAEPLPARKLAVFRESAPGAPLQLIRRCALRAAA